MSGPPTARYEYEHDPRSIYRRSFATIRAEASLDRFPAELRPVVVRMIHASGDPGLVADVGWHPGLVDSARQALERGAPIYTDATMIASGITRARLPKDNEIRCLLEDPRVPELARSWRTTRSAAANAKSISAGVNAVSNRCTTAASIVLALIERQVPVARPFIRDWTKPYSAPIEKKWVSPELSSTPSLSVMTKPLPSASMVKLSTLSTT